MGIIKADYLVTGIWMDKNKKITQLLLHKTDEQGEYESGEKVSVEEVLMLLKSGKNIRTMRWNYMSAKWTNGVLIKANSNADGSITLKSATDNIITDNLEHLMLLNGIM